MFIATGFCVPRIPGSGEGVFRFAKDALKHLPPFRRLFQELEHYRRELRQWEGAHYVEPGHFYSPLPSHAEVKAREQAIWGEPPRCLSAVDLNEEGQVALLREFKSYYQALPFEDKPTQGLRYYFDNPTFSYADAIVLYSMIRHQRPQRIIEIGSGFSSAVILDTNDLFFDGTLACTFIEPFPDKLLPLFKDTDRDRHRLIIAPLQSVGTDPFKELSENDILFVDSSHVAKAGGEVNQIFFDILPALAKNVLIHFHDVFFPFEYPKEWVYEGRAWNEAYMLRAFLQYNNTFKIVFFNSFLSRFHHESFQRDMPLCLKNPGGSIWLKKTK
jgi:Methyltransferase domain